MSEPQNHHHSKRKWIAIAAVFFFAVSGGVYQLIQHRGADSHGDSTAANSGGDTPTTNTVASNPSHGIGANSASPGTTALTPNTSSASSPSTTSLTATAGNGAAHETASGRNVGSVSPGVAGASPGGSVTVAGVHGATVPGVIPAAPAVAAAMPGALPVVETQDQCVTITYHHKTAATHSDEESCSHHKNLLKLPKIAAIEGLRIAPATVCVRVNGTPVHYLTVKNHADELIFGSIAGPKSKVTVRYCTGKATSCAKEDCNVPKDEFMEAIGGGEGTSQSAKLGQWDPESKGEKEVDVMAKLDGEVKKELETNDDLNGRAPAGELFKDWIGETAASVCGTAQAKN